MNILDGYRTRFVSKEMALSETIAITETGGEILTPHRRELAVV
jgi:hypothetical protein